MITRSRKEVFKPNPKYALTSEVDDITEPKNVNETLAPTSWLEAMKEELSTLDDNQTWDLVNRTPDTNIISTKWVFKMKYRAANIVDRVKARLAAKGYNQQQDRDYSKTFFPVVKPTTVLLVLSMEAIHNQSVHHLDVKNAFLNGFLEKNLCVTTPWL